MMLDVMLPGMDGMTACRRLRESGCTSPVLMLTARDAVPDRVTGLEFGADDYLVKPVAFDELLARIRALLRRTSAMSSVITFSDFELDTAARIAYRRNEIIRLSRTEYELLTLFLDTPVRRSPVRRSSKMCGGTSATYWMCTSRACAVNSATRR